MSVIAVVTILYLATVYAVGYLTSKRRAGGVKEFLVAGGNLPWFLLVPFLMAEYITGSTTVGVTEHAHKEGVSILMYYLGSPVGLTLLAFIFAGFYKSLKKMTLGEVVGSVFDRKTRLLCVIAMLVLNTITTNTAPIGLATIIAPMFNVTNLTAVWISTAFMVVLAIVGLRGQAWMNVIHFVAIVTFSLVVTAMAVNTAGGLGNLLASVPPEHLNPMGMGAPKTVAWVIGSSVIKLVSLIAITGVFAARSDRDAKIGAVSTGIFVLCFSVLPVIIGLAARVILPDLASRDALYKMGEHLGIVASSMVSIVVLAAIVSTTPSMLLALAGLFTRDIFLPCKPDCSDKKQVLICRLAIVVIAVIGTAAAYTLTKTATIWSLIASLVQIMTIIALPLIISVVWRRIDATAAFWTILTGVVSGLTWAVLGITVGSPFKGEPLWPVLAISTPVLILSSLIKKPSPYKGARGLQVAEEPVIGGS